MRKLLLAYICLIPAAFADSVPQPLLFTPNSSFTITGTIPSAAFAESITFGGGISVNTRTGEVTIPQGMNLTDASKRFWNAVASVKGAAKPFPDQP